MSLGTLSYEYRIKFIDIKSQMTYFVWITIHLKITDGDDIIFEPLKSCVCPFFSDEESETA